VNTDFNLSQKLDAVHGRVAGSESTAYGAASSHSESLLPSHLTTTSGAALPEPITARLERIESILAGIAAGGGSEYWDAGHLNVEESRGDRRGEAPAAVPSPDSTPETSPIRA
jgi:hypothetical protein